MSTNVIYLKSKEAKAVHISTLKHLMQARKESIYSSTIHVNPLCTSNKILVNKEKLNKGIRNNEAQPTLQSTERIYYNPKFLSKQEPDAASSYINSSNTLHFNKSEAVKTFDSNIHINRNYLVTLNDTRTVKPLNYLSDETSMNASKPNRGGIHINPKFIQKQKKEKLEPDKTSDRILSSTQTVKNLSNRNISPIKKKNFAKNTVINSRKNNFKLSVQPKSKYKFVKNVNLPKTQSPLRSQITLLKPFCIKTKYSLKRLAVGKENNKMYCKDSDIIKMKTQINSKIKTIKPPSEFKKLSRTKLVRKSILQSMILARRSSRNNLFKKLLAEKTSYKRISLKKKTANITYFPKRNEQMIKNKCENFRNNSFKRFSKMKIVRKSILKAKIEARNQVRKQYLRDLRIIKSNNKRYVSKFKLRNDIRRKCITKERSLLKWKRKKQSCDTSRIKCKKANSLPSSKSLRKNNQPCPFYNRFGRCKGKERGTCPKLHDPKYISICRKFLQGECSAKDCLLSHDIRPGKMPTCHHYLAGLCTRSNCPYLHIKVNPKAPICTAFLQGFCPDVFNCLKRHEFICPIYAEKGACPRGKSCTYPHRSPVVHSKLLRDDQKPLLTHHTEQLLNVNNETNSIKEVSESTLDCDDRKKGKRNNLKINKHLKKSKKEYIKEPFTRYFAVSKSDESCENDELKEKESIVDVNIDEFR